MARYNLERMNQRVLGSGVGKTGEPGDDGEDGTDGEDGADGVSPTISIGTVTTVAPGSSASVTDSGTPPDVVLDFEIPAGETGATGSGGAFDSGSDDPNDLIYSPSPPDGAIYIRSSVGAYIYIVSLSPHWRQFAS